MTEETQQKACPRKRPCASCPYRRNAPSGVWAADEYEKLPRYDAETFDQPVNMFRCHLDEEGVLCAGWVAHADATELLALRIAYARGEVDGSVFEYTTDVPLFESGEEAAAHGLRELARPGAKALATIDKLERFRKLREGH